MASSIEEETLYFPLKVKCVSEILFALHQICNNLSDIVVFKANHLRTNIVYMELEKNYFEGLMQIYVLS